MAKGNGIEKKGKTKGKNLGNTGPSIGVQNAKFGSGVKQPSGKAMKAVGRNLARANNQRGR